MKAKVIDIQILNDGDKLISSVCQGATITLTVQLANGSYQIFLVEKNDANLFKLVSDYKLMVSRIDKTPLVKTTPADDGNDAENGLRAYTI
jgi:Flp pilus assembly protein TadG